MEFFSCLSDFLSVTSTAHLQHNNKMSKLSDEEGKKLIALFDTMDVKPEGTTPDELRDWMRSYLDTHDDEDEAAQQVQPAAAAVAAGHLQQQLRLSVTFSGDEAAKGDCRYDLWKYEVDCLVKEGIHSEETIRHVIRRSLKGEAAHVLKRLGPRATVKQILKKFDGVYGIVEAGEETLAEFYSARQKEDEDVSTWGCRLEELLDRAISAGVIGGKDTDEMLCKRFWTGLRPKLKEASRHKFDTITDFDRLRVVVRGIAHEFKDEDRQKDSSSKKVSKAATVKEDEASGDSKSFNELKGLVCKLANKVDAMQDQLAGLKQGAAAKDGNKQQDPKDKDKGKDTGRGDNPAQGSSNTPGCWNCQDPNHRRYECPLLPECFKCHKRGHVQKYCRLNRK